MNSHDLILDHYHNPKNFGKLSSPTHHAETENLSCGDSLSVDIIFKNGIMEEIGWTGSGCALSQASASLLSELIKGKNLEDIQRLSKESVFSVIGISPSPARARCTLLALETIHRALQNESQELKK